MNRPTWLPLTAHAARTASVRADKAIRIERSRTFWYNGSLRRMAGGARARRRRVVWPSGSGRTRRRAAAGVDPSENQHHRLRGTNQERKLVSGCSPKRALSLLYAM